MHLDYLRITRKRAPPTIYKYDLLRRGMEKFARRRRLSILNDFSLEVLERFQLEWHEGALTCSKKLERLKAFFRRAFLKRWVDLDPAKELLGPDPPQRPTLPFTRSEMADILSAVAQYPDKSGNLGRSNAIRLRAFVLTLRYTGMRIGDVTSLRIDQVDGNRLFLYAGKTGEPVRCILPEFLAEALRELPRLSETYYFWTGHSTLHTAVGIWQRTLKGLFKLAKIDKGYAHRFRDTFSVELLLAEVPIEQISMLLGHSDIRITQKYYSPWVRDRQNQLEKSLDRAWRNDPIAYRENQLAVSLRQNARDKFSGLQIVEVLQKSPKTLKTDTRQLRTSQKHG